MLTVKKRAIEDNPQTPEDEVALFLKDIASVNDEYRGIPIVQVNKFLIEQYNKREGKAVFEEEELEAFLSSDLENIHNLNEEEFRRKIREYIAKNISCGKIPRVVSLYYPHDVSELKHFRIVDTPGINATGGLEDRTKEFINEANAVICLQKVPLENKALKDALDKLPKRVKDRLILVLTHRSDPKNEDEKERILDEAEKLYSKIGSSNIFFVDSLTELHLPKFYGVETITMDKINNILIADQKLNHLAAKFFTMAAGNPFKFIDRLERQANFRGIRERIKKDSQKSASNQMKEFASHLGKNYKDLGDRISERIIEPCKSRYKDPQIFASNIQNKRKKIDKIESDYEKSISSLMGYFSPCNSNGSNEYYNYNEIDQIVNDAKNSINNTDERIFSCEQDVLSHLEKVCQKHGDKTSNFVDSLEKKFVDSLRVEAQRITGKDIELQSRMSVPRISVNNVWEEALNIADKEIKRQIDEIEGSRWRPFKTLPFHILDYIKKRSIRKSRPQQIWQKIQPLLKDQLEKNKTLLHKEIEHFINQCCDKEYKCKFDETIREPELALKKLQEEEKANDELAREISRLQKEKKNIDDKIQICQRIGGNL